MVETGPGLEYLKSIGSKSDYNHLLANEELDLDEHCLFCLHTQTIDLFLVVFFAPYLSCLRVSSQCMFLLESHGLSNLCFPPHLAFIDVFVNVNAALKR